VTGKLRMFDVKGLLYENNYEKTSANQHLKKPFGLSNKGEFSEQLRD
jgi:hypothetical protein